MSTTDVIEEVLSPKQNLIRLIIVGVSAASVSGSAVYFISNRKLKAKYEKIAMEEISQAKEFYSALNKKDDFSTPEKAVGKLIPKDKTVAEATDALRSYRGEVSDEEDETTEVEVEEVDPAEPISIEGEGINIFLKSTPNDDWDIEEEMKTRTPDAPYIISSDEFMLNEPEHSQTTITYYEGDGTLADERDQEIPFIEPVVGEENLYHFGHGSGDNRLVYIRNERLSADFEVVKSDGKFSYEVLGLQHSDGGVRGRRQENELRKFRGEDE